MKTVYLINWDNGVSDCGTFPWEFDSFEKADAYGRDWAIESNLRDFGEEDPPDGYSYDVIEKELPEDEDADESEGEAHERMRRECRP